MLLAEQINPFKLPSVPVEQRRALPEQPGVYFAIGKGCKLLYIGKTGNLRKRLARHEHGSLFDYMGSVRLAWLEVENGELDMIEAELIRRFRPKLNTNHIPVEKPVYQPPMDGKELTERREKLGMSRQELATALQTTAVSVWR